jgi:hypothetical protein
MSTSPEVSGLSPQRYHHQQAQHPRAQKGRKTNKKTEFRKNTFLSVITLVLIVIGTFAKHLLGKIVQGMK